MSIISDLAALARAGFTPAQVKEILKIQVTETESKPEEVAVTIPKEELQPEPQKNEPEVTEPENKNKDQENETLSELRKELERVRNDLAKAQMENVRKDNSGNEPNKQEQLNDIVRAFM